MQDIDVKILENPPICEKGGFAAVLLDAWVGNAHEYLNDKTCRLNLRDAKPYETLATFMMSSSCKMLPHSSSTSHYWPANASATAKAKLYRLPGGDVKERPVHHSKYCACGRDHRFNSKYADNTL